METFMDKSRRYYIAGPMTGYPQFNVPLFDAVAATLRAEGLDVTSPAELDSAPMRKLALASEHGNMADVASEGTWGDCLARDVKMLADELDDIVLLPGWAASRGAVLEAVVGLLCAAKFYIWCVTDDCPHPVTREWVAETVGGVFRDRA
jgi:hypothetical protein